MEFKKHPKGSDQKKSTDQPAGSMAGHISPRPKNGAQDGHGKKKSSPLDWMGGGGPSKVDFSEKEAGTIKGEQTESRMGEKIDNPTIEDSVVEGAHGMEHHEDDETKAYLGGAADTVDKTATLTPGASIPGLPAAQLPAILHMIEKGEYGKASFKLVTSIAPTEYAEAYEYLLSTFGKEVAEKVGAQLVTGGARGASANVLASLVLWTYEGLMSIGEAHEEGDRDARISIYATAFADAFLNGGHSNPGALTEEEREAVKKGVEAGRAAAARLGENAPAVGKSLLEKYGSADNVKHALVDQLLEHAGIRGVKTHEAKSKGKSEK